MYPPVKLGLELTWFQTFGQPKVEEKWVSSCLQKTPSMHSQEYVMKTTQKFDNEPKHPSLFSTYTHPDVIYIFGHPTWVPYMFINKFSYLLLWNTQTLSTKPNFQGRSSPTFPTSFYFPSVSTNRESFGSENKSNILAVLEFLQKARY